MSDSDSSSSDDKSRSRSGSGKKVDGSPRGARRSKSSSRSRSRSRGGRSSKSRSRSRSYRRHRSRTRSRSRSYDRKRSHKHDRSGGRRSYRDRSPSPYSGRRRNHGDRVDRDNPRQSRCLGIFGMNLATTEADVRELFERYGPVEDIQIVYDHQSGRSRGFGFVYMRNVEDAAEAKEMLPGTELDGHKVRVDYSITNRPHTPTPGVYLGRPTTGYRRSNRSPPPYARRAGYGDGRRRSPSYSRSYSRSPRRY